MSGVYLFDIASLQARHLAVRQATIAGNVANANTPDYKARDVTPFAEVLAQTGFGMAKTASAHVEGAGPMSRTQASADGWDVMETASSVSTRAMTSAEIIDAMTPMVRVTPKPLIGPEPRKNSSAAARSVVTLESMIALHALLKPTARARLNPAEG